jgi:hypothetical protein
VIPLSNLYDVALPVFRQTLGSVAGVLEKGAAFARETGIDTADLLNARLYDDMNPLAFQVAQSVTNSMGAVRKLRGEQDVPFLTTYDSYAEAQASVAEGIAYLAAVKPGDLDGAADREVIFKFPNGQLRFNGQGYLMSFALPNFYFHAATAYGVLRHKGVPLGKRDFLGELQLLS